MIHPIPILKDNYVWALSTEDGVIIVDPGEALPVIDWLSKTSQTLKAILITHHHQDHIGGVAELRQKTQCLVYGNKKDEHRIPDLTHSFELNSASQVTFTIAGIQILAWETPGHTIGHCCYYAPDFKILFCGDTLFSMGCGRLFEGSPKDMFASLAIIKALPSDTLICCTHEYTLSNLDFALSLRPQDQKLLDYQKAVQKLRESNKPSLPSELGKELTLNPFLRAETVEEFSRLRQLKDQF